MSYSVGLRHHDPRPIDDAQVLLRLGTDADVDLTIKSSLGHYFGYAAILAELGLPGRGALTLSVYLLEAGDHRASSEPARSRVATERRRCAR